MIRIVVQEVALFLTPFVLYAVFLALRRRRILDLETWSKQAAGLALAGIALAIAAFLVTGLFGERNTGRYVPPRMEDGQLVPGHFE